MRLHILSISLLFYSVSCYYLHQSCRRRPDGDEPFYQLPERTFQLVRDAIRFLEGFMEERYNDESSLQELLFGPSRDRAYYIPVLGEYHGGHGSMKCMLD